MMSKRNRPTVAKSTELCEEVMKDVQFSFFEVKEVDSQTAKKNKQVVLEIMEEWEQKKILKGISLKQFKILDCKEGPNALVYIVEEKEGISPYFQEIHQNIIQTQKKLLKLFDESSDNTQEDELTKKIVKRIAVFVNENNQMNTLKPFQTLANIDHPNFLKIEKVFFTKEVEDSLIYCNFVTPYIKQDLLSWMFYKHDSELRESASPTSSFLSSNTSSSSCKNSPSPSPSSFGSKSPKSSLIEQIQNTNLKSIRTFQEVRYVLRQILLALKYLHSQTKFHLNLKFSNILIDQQIESKNPTQEISSSVSSDNEANEHAKDHKSWKRNPPANVILTDFGPDFSVMQKWMKQFSFSDRNLMISHLLLPPEYRNFSVPKTSNLAANQNESENNQTRKNDVSMDLEQKQKQICNEKYDIYSFGMILHLIFVNDLNIFKILTGNIQEPNTSSKTFPSRSPSPSHSGTKQQNIEFSSPATTSSLLSLSVHPNNFNSTENNNSSRNDQVYSSYSTYSHRHDHALHSPKNLSKSTQNNPPKDFSSASSPSSSASSSLSSSPKNQPVSPNARDLMQIFFHQNQPTIQRFQNSQGHGKIFVDDSKITPEVVHKRIETFLLSEEERIKEEEEIERFKNKHGLNDSDFFFQQEYEKLTKSLLGKKHCTPHSAKPKESFVNEDEEISKINGEKLHAAVVSQSILEDMCKIIKACISNNPSDRPTALQLLKEHEFFSET